jgi:hypothetical protein
MLVLVTIWNSKIRKQDAIWMYLLPTWLCPLLPAALGQWEWRRPSLPESSGRGKRIFASPLKCYRVISSRRIGQNLQIPKHQKQPWRKRLLVCMYCRFRHNRSTNITRYKGKVFAELKILSTTPRRCMREWSTDPRILDLGTSWKWLVIFSRLLHYPPGKLAICTHWIGGWVGPRTFLEIAKRRKILPLPGLELGPLVWPARSRSLYWLS